jgi:hypothetical protein
MDEQEPALVVEIMFKGDALSAVLAMMAPAGSCSVRQIIEVALRRQAEFMEIDLPDHVWRTTEGQHGREDRHRKARAERVRTAEGDPGPTV